jgi:hypothetical protein
MRLKNKLKIKKIDNFFRNSNAILFFQYNNLELKKNWFNFFINKFFFIYKIKNSFLKYYFRNSQFNIYKNFFNLNILILNNKILYKRIIIFKLLKKNNLNLFSVFLKLNKKIYFKNQFERIIFLNFKIIIKKLKNMLEFFIKYNLLIKLLLLSK